MKLMNYIWLEDEAKLKNKARAKVKASKNTKKSSSLNEVAKFEWLPNHYQWQMRHLP